MREFQARKKRKILISKILESWWFLTLLFIIFVLFASGLYRVYLNYSQVKENTQNLQDEIDKLNIKKENIENDMYRLGNDYGLDYEIRRKLDIQKPDEKVIKIID